MMIFISYLALCGLAAALREQVGRSPSDCDFNPHRRGLGLDAHFQLEQKCQMVECAGIHKAWAKIRQDRQGLNVFNFALVTGQSNAGKWFKKKCACGDFQEASQQCNVKTKKGMSTNTKPCCSKLDDCNPSDEWPAIYWEAARFRREQTQAIKGLYDTCMASCDLRYRKLCMQDLESHKEAFDAQSKLLGPPPSAYDRKYLEWADRLDKLKEQEKVKRMERIWAIAQKEKKELYDISSWTGKFQRGSTSMPCCNCLTSSAATGDAHFSSFCTASACPTHCKTALWAGFCGRDHTKTCPTG